jgi:hypothetical protein
MLSGRFLLQILHTRLYGLEASLRKVRAPSGLDQSNDFSLRKAVLCVQFFDVSVVIPQFLPDQRG